MGLGPTKRAQSAAACVARVQHCAGWHPNWFLCVLFLISTSVQVVGCHYSRDGGVEAQPCPCCCVCKAWRGVQWGDKRFWLSA